MNITHVERSGKARFFPLLAVLLVALALRLLLWDHIPRTGLISDEGEYLSAASWLAQGRGFSWYQGYLWTRAPVYPLFVAAHLWLFGDTLTPIYVTQTVLSLVNVALVYMLALHLITGDRRLAAGEPASSFSITHFPFSIPTLSALLIAAYFPFAIYPQALLSETLYITLLLGGFLALACWFDERRGVNDQIALPEQTADTREILTKPFALVRAIRGSPRWLVAAGVLFGLATLTRSLTLGFLPLVVLWLLLRRPAETRAGGRRLVVGGLWHALIFIVTIALVILPWTIYNSRLYGGLVLVDTSGAFNLALGGRSASDGARSDEPTRNFVLALLKEKLTRKQRLQLIDKATTADGQIVRAAACLLRHDDPHLRAALAEEVDQISQAERQQLMTAEGLCLIREKPLAFAQKTLGELLDFFQINYSGDERFTNNFTLGRLPRWYSLGLFLLDDTLYVLALPLSVIGFVLYWRTARAACRKSDITILIGLWWLYAIGIAPLLFAINRFRLPLLPFAFIFAVYALALLPRGWRALRTRGGWVAIALAALLLLVATTPYAYLEPREPGSDSTWASYLGPYPSSLKSTFLAFTSRPNALRVEQIRRALQAGDVATARDLLAAGPVDIARSAKRPEITTTSLFRSLLSADAGDPGAGLAALPFDTITRTKDVEAAVARGDLLRSMGDLPGARAAFTPEFVDNNNPVQWAWDWLRPVPTKRIDFGGNLDLGYIVGCYLGEGDQSVQPATTFRWCTDGARLRFPGTGTGAPQALILRVDGRGWPNDMLPIPPVRIMLGDQDAGSFAPDHNGVGDFSITLPASPVGADIVVTLRSTTFIPDASRYLSQQGSQVGQVQRLGVRLDWAELREAKP